MVMGSTDSEVVNGKPAPDIFLIAAKRFPDSPSPEKVIFINLYLLLWTILKSEYVVHSNLEMIIISLFNKHFSSVEDSGTIPHIPRETSFFTVQSAPLGNWINNDEIKKLSYEYNGASMTIIKHVRKTR